MKSSPIQLEIGRRFLTRRWLKLREVHLLLGGAEKVSRRTIQRWVRAGKLPGMKRFGSRYEVDVQALAQGCPTLWRMLVEADGELQESEEDEAPRKAAA